MLKIIMLAICVAFLVSCQKNSFESCVAYYEQKAKKRALSGGEWEKLSEYYIDEYCKNK